MKITYYGTSASEAWPALFCNCEACELARQLGGKNIRTRSQALVDTTLLLDFPPDTNYHAQQYHLDLRKVETLLITHSHHDHFFPYDICMRTENYATGLSDKKLTVYGNEEVESRFCQAARIDGSVSKFVRFQRLEPFDCVNTEDGYEITAVLADHNQPEKSLLYGRTWHDGTGRDAAFCKCGGIDCHDTTRSAARDAGAGGDTGISCVIGNFIPITQKSSAGMRTSR